MNGKQCLSTGDGWAWQRYCRSPTHVLKFILLVGPTRQRQAYKYKHAVNMVILYMYYAIVHSYARTVEKIN